LPARLRRQEFEYIRHGTQALTAALDVHSGDYRAKGKTRYKTMTLSPEEFMRRFLLHVLPSGFHRIRHINSNAQRHPPSNGGRADSCVCTRSDDHWQLPRPTCHGVGPQRPHCRAPHAQRTSSPNPITVATLRKSP
jgi:hypothetical protein